MFAPMATALLPVRVVLLSSADHMDTCQRKEATFCTDFISCIKNKQP